jgi:tetratricopeptide (TPR) repeat protein
MKILPPVIVAAFFLLAFPLVSFSSAEERGIFLSEAVQLRLADAFLAEGEYYRAITEYKKFRILFPGSPQGDRALFRTGIAYYLGEEYEAASRSFETLASTCPNSGYVEAALYFGGLNRWKQKDYAGAAELFDGLIRKGASSAYAPRALVARSLLDLDRGDADAAAEDLERFLSIFPGHPDEARVREALPLVRQYEKLPQKSELLAGILAAILPGSGYVYAGHYGDGLTAFLLNGLFIAGTVTAVQSGWYAASGLSGGIGLPFYIGNIYGSMNAAKKYNNGIRREMRARIAASLDAVIDDRKIPDQ